tara:strand:+ start:530 stop:658 length:129 start_codon:yes stop_codon:yes gene_type:complete
MNFIQVISKLIANLKSPIEGLFYFKLMITERACSNENNLEIF